MNNNSKFYKAFDEITTPDKVVENIDLDKAIKDVHDLIIEYYEKCENV